MRKSFYVKFCAMFLMLVIMLNSAFIVVASATEANGENETVLDSLVADATVGTSETIDLSVEADDSSFDKIKLVPENSVSFSSTNSVINNRYSVEYDGDYDSVSVIYMSTDGIQLDSKSFVASEFENNELELSFAPLNNKLVSLNKDVFDYSEDNIVINLSFLKDADVVLFP